MSIRGKNTNFVHLQLIFSSLVSTFFFLEILIRIFDSEKPKTKDKDSNEKAALLGYQSMTQTPTNSLKTQKD